ncbi:germ cell nuclear acidic protein-like isoform X2 [Ranitomeya variabilis]|uniref:germ cell nuclear acidic protein-like isoform X2 n=1 Tax=Ranitomeya variabilis TaxID=490064 RepID=UPI004056400F
MRWRALESFEGLMLERMDVRRVVVVLFTIFFYCVEGRPAKTPEAVSQSPWAETFPTMNGKISDDNNNVKVQTSDRDLDSPTSSDDDITNISDHKDSNSGETSTNSSNEPSASKESANTQDTMPLCKIPGCFLEDIISPNSIYVTNFQETKNELAERLYKLYNKTIFWNQLPTDTEIVWNNMVTQMAGMTYKIKGIKRDFCVIDLYDRVLNSAERLRTTLAHEMCHVACWLLDNKKTDNHGLLWQAYAKRVNFIHPELPEVTEYHNYTL